jgi:hypothetical protein
MRRSPSRRASRARRSRAREIDRLTTDDPFAKIPTIRMVTRGLFVGGGSDVGAAVKLTCVGKEVAAPKEPDPAFVAVTVHEPALVAVSTPAALRPHPAEPVATI